MKLLLLNPSDVSYGGSGGTNAAWFETTEERDTYYSENPDKLISGAISGIGDPVQAFMYDGTQWIDGAIAFKGPKGDQGDQGEIGPAGIQGLQGPKGPKGDTGEKGDKGDQGIQGVQGIQGLKGATGEQGVDGKSAYQVWLDSGNTGTEQDFLDSLKGDKGDPGDAGSLPVGGTTGQVLTKLSNTDGDAGWTNSGGASGSITKQTFVTSASNNIDTELSLTQETLVYYDGILLNSSSYEINGGIITFGNILSENHSLTVIYFN